MLSPKTRNLLLASTCVGALLAFLFVTIPPADTKKSTPIKSKLMRRHDRRKEKANAIEVAALRKQLQEKKERAFEDRVSKHLPVKVKLKREKETRFKDLDNYEWLGDFELEVTNTSDRPIYFLEFWLMLPDTMTENNNPLAFSLRFGRPDFINFDTRPLPTDVRIEPGASYTFTVPLEKQRGWREFKTRRNAADPKNIRLKFVQLSFGDGTGFDGSGEAYPYKPGTPVEANLIRSYLSDEFCT